MSTLRSSATLSLALRFSVVILPIVLATAPHALADCPDWPEPGALTANPTRPSESLPGDPVQPGVVQLESGWTQSWLSDNAGQTSFPTMLRFGVWCNMEVRWNSSPVLRDTTPSTSVSGFGDNFIGGQYRFLHESKHKPSLSLGYTVKFPSANAGLGLGSGRNDHIATMMISKTLYGFSFTGNVNYFEIGQPAGRFNAKSEWVFCVAHTLRGRLGAMGEVYHDTHLNLANDAYTSSTWALTYNLTRRVVLDSGTYLSLSSGAGNPGRSAFVGVTYAVGTVFTRPGPAPAAN